MQTIFGMCSIYLSSEKMIGSKFNENIFEKKHSGVGSNNKNSLIQVLN